MALQEFLASYAVKVDEDGARRLQRILEQNEESAKGLSSGFEAARWALAGLKAELSDTTGLKDVLSSFNTGFSGLSLPKVNGEEHASVSSGGKTTVTVGADTSKAEEALEGYRSKAERMRPKLNVNTSGITSAVSSAIATVRSMMSSVSITIPVKAKATLDTSGLTMGSIGNGTGSSKNGTNVRKYATGGRVSSPTLAMVGEVGEPEYIIPVKDDTKALPLIRDMMGELSASARAQLAEGSGGRTVVNHSVAAPVNINVTSTAAPAEAVGQFIYDTAQRSLLKTLEGVFA